MAKEHQIDREISPSRGQSQTWRLNYFPNGKIISDMVLEKLPSNLDGFDLKIMKDKHGYYLINYFNLEYDYDNDNMDEISLHRMLIEDKSLPNALCKCFIYLIEEGIFPA